jgi:hypothetical protein
MLGGLINNAFSRAKGFRIIYQDIKATSTRVKGKI